MQLIEKIKLDVTKGKNILEINMNSNFAMQTENLLKAGCKEINISLSPRTPHKHGCKRLLLNNDIYENLSIPSGINLNMLYGNSKIILGPILGIYISKVKIDKLISGGWDSVYWDFQKWAKDNAGLLYFFMLKDIDWDDKKVTGYYFNSNKKWQKHLFPLPEVIYDRCFGKEGRMASYQLREYCAEKASGIKIYNQAVKIGKQDTYVHLFKYPKIKNFVPDFLSYSLGNLKYFLQKHDSIYLKPDKLYKGKGIVQITKEKENYAVQFRDEENNENKQLNYKDIHNLTKDLDKSIQLKENYILQNRIELAEFLGNKFDIRVMLQKNHPETWEVTALNARIAPSGSIITSPRSGGKVLRLNEVLSITFPGKEREIISEIENIACEVGKKLEDKFGFLAELGVDLGLDKSGEIWLIEVNGKPLKVSFSRMKDRSLGKIINQNPILLGFEMDGFKINEKKNIIPALNWKTYKLKKSNSGGFQPILYLNEHQFKILNITPEKYITIQVGLIKTKAKVKEQQMDMNSDTLYMSMTLFNELRIIPELVLNIISFSKDKIILGPTVGMTVSRDTWEYLPENIQELNKIAELAKEKGVLFYYFTPDLINWEKNLVEAYFLDSRYNSWLKRCLPFPQILYDQATFPFDSIKRLASKEANRELRTNHEIQSINCKRYFGKWDTYQAIAFFEETKRYIPNTALLTPLNLNKFINKYSLVYVKSNYGSFGWGVLQVKRVNNYYLCRGGGSQINEWKFTNLTKLYQFLLDNLGENTVLQEGITLAQLEGNPFDMRILAHKNISGKWVFSTISFRIAAPDAVVTNVSAGASEIIAAQEDKLPHSNLSWKKLEKFCCKTLLALESSFGNLGEVGLDVGLSSSGRLWLFEANSKPNTCGYIDNISKKTCDMIFGLPLDYSKYLAGRMFGDSYSFYE